MSTIVLGANITILIIGAKRGRGFENGFAVPMTGMADEMSWWSSAFHLLINALSTLLLAASNYTVRQPERTSTRHMPRMSISTLES
jgi:hypothetical protein